jgi:SSS family solute:Na+ symporter
MNAALGVIALFVVGALGLAVLARRGRTMSLEQWALGGRGLGAIMVFLLMAGESFSTFTFLGASGWSYSKGSPAFYILAYGGLAYLMAFWMLPAMWRYATATSWCRSPTSSPTSTTAARSACWCPSWRSWAWWPC